MKKLISILMSVIFVLSTCSVLAMAAESKELVYNGYGIPVSGELTDKVIKFSADNDGRPEYYCYEIKAKAAGIYKVMIDSLIDAVLTDEESTFVTDSISNNKILGRKDMIIDNSDDSYHAMYFKMKENETAYLVFSFYSGKAELSFTYSGEVKEIYTAPVIKECELLELESEYKYGYVIDTYIITDNDNIWLYNWYYNDKILDTIDYKINFFEETYSLKADVVSINDYIKSIELPNGFKPSYVLEYPGYTDGVYPEYVTVNFKDGSSAKVETDSDIKIPGIDYETYYLYALYDEGVLEVGVAGYEETFDAVVTKDKPTNAIKNIFSEFFFDVFNHLSWLINDVANLFPDKYQIYELFRDFGDTFLIGFRTIGTIIEYIAS